MQKFVSEVIGEDFEQYRPGDLVNIFSPPGTGKTTWLLNVLLPYAKKHGRTVLYLSNRRPLKSQVQKELLRYHNIPEEDLEEFSDVKTFDGITIMTYQHMAQLAMNYRNSMDYQQFREFYYVFGDEIHYLLKDSMFAHGGCEVMRMLKRKFPGAVIFFVTGTPEEVKPVLETEFVGNWFLIQEEFHTPQKLVRQYRSPVVEEILWGIKREKIWYEYTIAEDFSRVYPKGISSLEAVKELIKHTDPNEKWMVFLDDKRRGEQFVKEVHKNGITALLLTAENIGGEEGQRVIREQQFSQTVLVTTRVLDNGLTLRDRMLKHVVIDARDRTEFLQMLGRKRFVDETDYLNLYLLRKSLPELNGELQFRLRPKLKLYEIAETGDSVLLLKWMVQNDVDSIKPGTFTISRYGDVVVNKLQKLELKYQMQNLEDLIYRFKEEGDDAFLNLQMEWLQKPIRELEMVELPSKKMAKEELQTFLDSHSERMDKEQWSEFRDEVKNLAFAVSDILDRNHPKRRLGKDACNEILQNFGYFVEYEKPKRWLLKRGEKPNES